MPGRASLGEPSVAMGAFCRPGRGRGAREMVLSQKALEVLTSSATRGYESPYKKEVGGHLLGFFRDGKVHVVRAVHYRAGNAKRTWLEVSASSFRRKGRRLVAATGLDVVGEYHSHNDGSTMLSEVDKLILKKDKSPAMVVIRVSDAALPRQDSCLHFSERGSGYRFDICGYANDSNGKPSALRMRLARLDRQACRLERPARDGRARTAEVNRGKRLKKAV